jgi:hypothetical protein
MRTGSTQRTTAGVIRVDSVEVVDPATLTEEDARRSRVRSLAEPRPEARAELARRERDGVLLLTVSLAVGYEISPRGRAYLG